MNYLVKYNTPIADGICEMCMVGDTSTIKRSGQFAHVLLSGFFLRRPFSICEWTHDDFTIVYKLIGQGTRAMSAIKAGCFLDVLCGLGNGFDDSIDCQNPLLIGGGVGTPPLLGLCRLLIEKRKLPTVLLGFNTEKETILHNAFKSLGVTPRLYTLDGSLGIKGFVTDGMIDIDYDYFYACGPEIMLKTVYMASKTQGQISLEERMACGFGACMGCSCMTHHGAKRLCKEGPVLTKEEITW